MIDFINKRDVSRSKSVEYDAGLRAYFLGVYNYMASALALTGLVAMLVASSPALMTAIFGTPLQWLILFAPVVMAIYLSSRIYKMSSSAAQMMFWIYAALMGASLASIFVVFTGESIARAFFVTAATFGGVSIYGHTTKKDLTGIGSFMVMGLIGVVVTSLVNIFLQSNAILFVTSFLSVIIFTALTAYDTQRIKSVYYLVGAENSKDMANKAAISGALSLYLDFINLFISLLHFFGDRR